MTTTEVITALREAHGYPHTARLFWLVDRMVEADQQGVRAPTDYIADAVQGALQEFGSEANDADINLLVGVAYEHYVEAATDQRSRPALRAV